MATAFPAAVPASPSAREHAAEVKHRGAVLTCLPHARAEARARQHALRGQDRQGCPIQCGRQAPHAHGSQWVAHHLNRGTAAQAQQGGVSQHQAGHCG